MRFRAEHRFVAGVEPVAALLVDPTFHRQLAPPDLAFLDVVEARTDGDETRSTSIWRTFLGLATG